MASSFFLKLLSYIGRAVPALAGIIVGGITLVCSGFPVSADTAPFPYTDAQYTASATTDIGIVLHQTNQQGSVLHRLLDLFDINYADPSGTGKAIVYVQIIINYALALLWFIAILFFVYAFYMMFFGKSDDAFTQAKKTIMGAWFALLMIALSAYVVNFVFYIYNKGT